MSAAVAITPEACLQPELLGMPTPPVQAPAQAATEAALANGQPLRLSVMGVTVGNASVRETSSGSVRLEALIDQRIEHHPQAVRLWVSRLMPDMGSGALTMDHARRLAASMPAGTEVVALGAGLESGHQAGSLVFRLLQCVALVPKSRLTGNPNSSSSGATAAPQQGALPC